MNCIRQDLEKGEISMLPSSFLDRMQNLLGKEYEAFLASLEEEKYQALRVNPLKKHEIICPFYT